MNSATAGRLLAKLVRIATERGVPALEKLDTINSALDCHKCRLCGVDWERGGKQQGSALCAACYQEAA